jgi:hypothetical protein
MKKEQQTQQHVHVMSEDEAAGLRKQLIRFHCISCDRPIDVQPHPFVSFVIIYSFYFFSLYSITLFLLKDDFFSSSVFRQQASLPATQGMRPIQSPRPYTTYELDQIRQFQKRLIDYLKNSCFIICLNFSQQFSNEFSGGVADVYATVRQCGGSHTMTLPFKRQIKTQ